MLGMAPVLYLHRFQLSVMANIKVNILIHKRGITMRWKLAPYLLVVLMTCGIVGVSPVLAEDPMSKTSAAVTNILFEYDADEFASYSIRDSGFLDITFARNTPDALYSEMLNKLKKHPDIKGVLAGKGGPTCSRF